MKIAISGGLDPLGHSGGGEQFLVGLVYSLGRFDTDPSRTYTVLGRPTGNEWLDEYLGSNTRVIKPSFSGTQILRGMFGALPSPVRTALRRVRGSGLQTIEVPGCDEAIEKIGADVVHFPIQGYARCSIPTVYNPHDLQHRHFPEFFDPREIARRDATFSAGCREASCVVTESKWVKDDIVRQYHVDPQKIRVIYWGAPTDLYPDPTNTVAKSVAQRLGIPQEFILYPAQTWPHKNHIRLLEAMKGLRGKGVDLHLVCTGRKNDFWPQIARKIEELDLTGHVTFCGFVSPADLKAIYRLAHAVVFPTLFEGGGFPILEALTGGIPLACSRVCGLPEYAGDAAVYFDPLSVDSIAEGIEKVMTGTVLRRQLIEKGVHQAALFSWERMSQEYIRTYESVAGAQ